MSCEALVVASDTQTVKEVITDGENGFLVEFFSPEAIAEKVAVCLDNPSALTKIKKNARKTILERYSLDRTVAAQIDIIEQAAGKKAGTIANFDSF